VMRWQIPQTPDPTSVVAIAVAGREILGERIGVYIAEELGISVKIAAVDIAVAEAALADIAAVDIVVVDTVVGVAVAPHMLFELRVGASQIDMEGTYC